MAKKQIFKSFAELAETSLAQAAKHADVVAKTKRPRTLVVKKPLIEVEKVMYVPTHKFTAEEKQIYNAWNKYKNTGVYATMPEDQAYKLFIEDWNFRHDPTRIAIKDLNTSLNHSDVVSGTTTPDWMRKAMTGVVTEHPSALRTDLPAITVAEWTPTHSTSDAVLNIPDYFKPQQYRGINNIDTMFEQAEAMSALGAPDAANQFVSAGLADVAAIAKGLKPTSFKYKPTVGIVPMNVLTEMGARRGVSPDVVEWIRNINIQDPTITPTYLDLFMKHLDYFKMMYAPNGAVIK